MAAPIHLKANTPGGNSYRKSVSAQKTKSGSKSPVPSVSARKDNGPRAAAKNAAYAASNAKIHPKVQAIAKGVVDSTSKWMSQHGLKFAQNAKPRLDYASHPADHVGPGNPGPRKASTGPKGASKPRVTYTGKSYAAGKKSRKIGA